ncbi:MAG: hypothetical protein QM676_04455 [Novosphingobium sp.]
MAGRYDYAKLFAGWPELQRVFPDYSDAVIKRLHWQSGSIGKGRFGTPWGAVSYSGCLRFDVCLSGLRIAVWKLFAPFQQSILVSWSHIRVHEQKFLWLRYFRLHLGDTGRILTINQRAFRRIAESIPLAENFREFDEWRSSADQQAFDNR